MPQACETVKPTIHLVLWLALAVSLGLPLIEPISAQTLSVLHSFSSASGPNNGNNSDGANPSGTLILSGATLYGTARYGGASGWGTVFAINTDGTGFATTYNFTGGNDGANPSGGVILSNNTLYGTASGGGSAGVGTVFAVSTDGTGFANLHSFTVPMNDGFGFYTNSDGAYPQVGLLLSANILYGAANNGGTSGRGTLFGVSTSGPAGFSTLHSFSSGTGGSYGPSALIQQGNSFYGTDYANLGNGTAFAIHTDSTGFTNNYAFSIGHVNNSGLVINSDGANPHAKLLLSGNTVYGTAQNGGSSGSGTVFAMNSDGTGFRTLHSFAAGAYTSIGLYTNSDGAIPAAELILSGSTLYGTTSAGGRSGNGTVFEINTDGSGFTNLYTFTAMPPYPQPQINGDGGNPSGGLIFSSNTLYGVTANGGSCGNGTVFSLSLGTVSVAPPSLTIISSGGNVILIWQPNGCLLQSAPAASGHFTTIPCATSPYIAPIAGTQQQFYRLSR
jgi:uncharacterized repeat protein (TIGR03803 family)